MAVRPEGANHQWRKIPHWKAPPFTAHTRSRHAAGEDWTYSTLMLAALMVIYFLKLD